MRPLTGMLLQAFDIFQQPFKVAKLRVSAEKVMLLIARKTIDDGMLLHRFGVSAGKFEQLGIRYAG